MTMLTASQCHSPARPSVLSRAKSLIVVWQQRQALRALDERALNDIGITRREAEAEAARPFWDAPATWRR
jgi:uncharacterized protein YjiS (DUF1127 family)